MDKKVRELIANKDMAKNHLAEADTPEKAQRAVEELNRAEKALGAYIIFRKREEDYKNFVEGVENA